MDILGKTRTLETPEPGRSLETGIFGNNQNKIKNKIKIKIKAQMPTLEIIKQ